VPGGGVDKRRHQWKKKKGKYLFNQDAMSKVFRARFLAALDEAGLSIPRSIPSQWVVDCSHVGKGITALKYFSKYLYRGIISEKNIIWGGFFAVDHAACASQRIPESQRLWIYSWECQKTAATGTIDFACFYKKNRTSPATGV